MRNEWEEGVHIDGMRDTNVDGMGMSMSASTFNDRSKTVITLGKAAQRKAPFRRHIASRMSMNMQSLKHIVKLTWRSGNELEQESQEGLVW